MNGHNTTRGAAKPVRGTKPVPAKANGNGKVDKPGKTRQQHQTCPPANTGTPQSPARRTNTTKVYLDSQRRGLTEASPVAIVGKEFWMHVFAEVSAYRYPLFLHQLEDKTQEFAAIQHLYDLCKTILTKEECRHAVKTRLHRKAQRGEIKLYTENN